MARKLRFGPACYHVLHIIPVQIAHEMNFFYDEGLRDEDGKPNYEIVRGAWLLSCLRRRPWPSA